jgi:hypothetical protein
MQAQRLSPIIAAAVVAFAAAAQAQVAYPAHGQDAARQAQDESECSVLASRQTGFDPSTPPPAQVSAQKVTGSGARLVGAAGGAIIGGAAGNAGVGALAGAAGGGLIKRGVNSNRANKTNEANASAYQATRSAYLHARGTCLAGRGYTIK